MVTGYILYITLSITTGYTSKIEATWAQAAMPSIQECVIEGEKTKTALMAPGISYTCRQFTASTNDYK